MNDMVSDTASRLFSGYGPNAAAPRRIGAIASEPLWNKIVDAGFPLALLGEEEGGFGLSSIEALDIVRLAARHAIDAPLTETMFANWLLAGSRLPLADGPAAVAAHADLAKGARGWHLSGRADRVAWGREAGTLVVLVGDRMARVAGGWTAVAGRNLADEPRDDVVFDIVLDDEDVASAGLAPEALLAAGAVFRTVALAGAAEAVLERCVRYANERMQFGKPIGKFQAIQQNLAVMAGQVAAARAAADLAAAALPLARRDMTTFVIEAAAAKLRAGEAAGIVASIAHQVFGALGFTRECALQLLTRRLWSWRDEYGSEAYWAGILGSRIAAFGPGRFWPFIAGTEGVAA